MNFLNATLLGIGIGLMYYSALTMPVIQYLILAIGTTLTTGIIVDEFLTIDDKKQECENNA